MLLLEDTKKEERHMICATSADGECEKYTDIDLYSIVVFFDSSCLSGSVCNIEKMTFKNQLS